MTGAHWADDHSRWLQGRFPELGGGPAYIRTADEVPTLARQVGALAWTGAALDVRFRPILEPRGEWAGRGLAIVIANVEEFFAMSWSEQMGLLTHETAHQFDSWDSKQRQADFEWTARDEWYTHHTNVNALCTVLGMPPITNGEVAPINHGPTFTRAALHCWCRCRHEVSIDQMLAFADYYRSPAFEAAFEALRAELIEGGSIVDVLRTPMPPAFAKLWT